MVARQQFWIFRVSALTDPPQGHRCATCPTKCALPRFLLRCPSIISPIRHTKPKNPELLLNMKRVHSELHFVPESRSTNSASDTDGCLLSLFLYEWVVNDGSFLHPSSNSVSSHLPRLALDQIIITVVWMIIRFTQRRGWLQHLQTPVQIKSTFWFGGFHYEAAFSLFSSKASWNHTEILKYVHFFIRTLCVIHDIKGSWIVFVPWEIINEPIFDSSNHIWFLILCLIFEFSVRL